MVRFTVNGLQSLLYENTRASQSVQSHMIRINDLRSRLSSQPLIS